MIRNKTNLLVRFKPRVLPPNQNYQELPPLWFEEYFEHKQLLIYIIQKNEQLNTLVERMDRQKSVLLIDKINNTLKSLFNENDRLQKWIESLDRYQSSQLQKEILINIKKYFLSEITLQSRRLQFNKNKFQYINNQQLILNQSFTNNNNNVSQRSINLNRSFTHQDLNRNQDFIEVSTKIENLNQLLKRMNNLVFQQGSLVDRIDENMRTAEQNMNNAKKNLKQRLDRQQGTNECSFEGRANKIIMSLYIADIGCIFAWFLKKLLC